jgi:RNA polymerase sigma-70 factor, ECF subfamily
VEVDDDFLKRLRRGNAEAYKTLVRRYETPLYRYFLATHGDPRLASEQSVDCFSDLVESIPKMTGGVAQLRAFVFAVAKNVLRRQWRRCVREPTQLLSVAEPVDDWPRPDAAMQAAEESERVLTAIRSLDESTRDVFLLRFVEQMSLAEIVAATGEPIGTVKSRLHRGRLRLQEILQSTGGIP